MKSNIENILERTKLMNDEPDLGNPKPTDEPEKPKEPDFKGNNNDFEGYINNLKRDEFIELLNKTEEGKKAKDKLNDLFLSSYTAAEGGQSRVVKKAVEDALLKAETEFKNKYLPEETPEQKRLRELEEKLAANEKKEEINAIKEDIINSLEDKEMVVLLDLIVSGNKEESLTRLTRIQDYIKIKVDTEVQKKIDEKIKESERTPNPGKPETTKKLDYREEKKVRKLTRAEKMEILTKNRED